MDTSKPSVTIIGTGALGATLEQFLRENRYTIRSTWNSNGGMVFSDNPGGFQTVLSTIPTKNSETGDWIFITTPDDLISKTARLLSETPVSWEEKTVVHCSGNLTADELKVLSGKGAKTVSMHPIQTFKKGDGPERFRDIYISLQGDSEARELLKPFIKEMGAVSISLDKKQKRNLHIAAVMASNYLVALMFSVQELLKDAELEEGFDSLQTLIHQTVTNVFQKGPQNALTGPVSRGDTESVQTHLEELKGKEQEALYKILGLEALKIAENSENVTQDQIKKMKQLLSN